MEIFPDRLYRVGRGGLMYLQACGWQVGKKDKIDLEGSKLKEKEGLYTCPPIAIGQKPFHCCLKVREELIKVTHLPCILYPPTPTLSLIIVDLRSQGGNAERWRSPSMYFLACHCNTWNHGEP
jgi:hypothetical protein